MTIMCCNRNPTREDETDSAYGLQYSFSKPEIAKKQLCH